MMKTLLLGIGLVASLGLIALPVLADSPNPSAREGYLLLQEAEAASASGDSAGAAQLQSRALEIFRLIALEAGATATDGSSRPIELERQLPESSPELGKLALQQELILRQQQLILQKIARIEAENLAIRGTLESIGSDTRDIPEMASDVQDIRDETELLADFDSRLDQIEDNTQDIPEVLDTIDEIDNNVGDLAGVGDAFQDVRDNRDLLDQIISIVEDIKNDTDRIGDVESAVEDVKDEVDGMDK